MCHAIWSGISQMHSKLKGLRFFVEDSCRMARHTCFDRFSFAQNQKWNYSDRFSTEGARANKSNWWHRMHKIYMLKLKIGGKINGHFALWKCALLYFNQKHAKASNEQNHFTQMPFQCKWNLNFMKSKKGIRNIQAKGLDKSNVHFSKRERKNEKRIYANQLRNMFSNEWNRFQYE